MKFYIQNLPATNGFALAIRGDDGCDGPRHLETRQSA